MLFLLQYQIDLETILEHLKDILNQKPKLLLAHSMGGCIGLRNLLRDTTFQSAIFSAPLWGLPVSDLTVSILIPIFNLAISMGLGLLTYPYKIDGFNILTKPFEKNLLTKNIPDPDMLVRTGNTKRLSNFLLWQLAYSEIYFEKKLWPEFNENDYNRLIRRFKNTKRNFGNI